VVIPYAISEHFIDHIIFMETDKTLRLLIRQLKDIQSQADKILTGEDSSEAIETFAQYSRELKEYIQKNVASNEVKAYLTQLPEIEYARPSIQLWQYLILPAWWIALYKDYQEKNRMKEEINLVRGKYATLELLVRGLPD
jgi:hypothetical protein